jgi:serine protease AprX
MVDSLPCRSNIRQWIVCGLITRFWGAKDFVDPTAEFYKTHYHGMSVLSCMGGNVPGKLIGTATKASYWLIRSEDTGSEFLIEEDNWVAAAEFADSAGVDIINSSLGYYNFDNSEMNHPFEEMDGKTTRVTRGANIAASKGILVFSSAGNEGNNIGENAWKHIVAPSDGEKVIGVGAVNKDSIPSGFTSLGPAFGGKTKPNVTALGWNTYLQRSPTVRSDI